MARLRFAILKSLDDRDRTVLEYDQEHVLDRLKALTRENLAKTESVVKRKWNKDEVAQAQAAAFTTLVGEFKAETVKLLP